MKKIIIIALILVCANSNAAIMAQLDEYKALFMYIYSKNIQWPEEYEQGDFIIGVMGNSPVIEELQKIAKKKKAGNQNIVVVEINSPAEIIKCHMLYLPKISGTVLNSIRSDLSEKPTVIITENDGLAGKNVDINFVIKGGNLNFQINRPNIEKKGLAVASFLITLGVDVQ